MRFVLLDKITELKTGESITAIKNVSLAEEFLADHFPRFPVLPGVFMLEAATQACAWLIRASEDFAHSIVLLKEARNIRYSSFVAPGETLTISAEIRKQDERETQFQFEGKTAGDTNVSGRLVLERYNLADMNPDSADTDCCVTNDLRKMFRLLYR